MKPRLGKETPLRCRLCGRRIRVGDTCLTYIDVVDGKNVGDPESVIWANCAVSADDEKPTGRRINRKRTNAMTWYRGNANAAKRQQVVREV